MSKNQLPIILASTSVYRANLLRQLNLAFDSVAPEKVHEEEFKKIILDPAELAARLAFEKANSLKEKYPDHIIIGSDQVVALNNAIFSKPYSVEKAKIQLQQLRGKKHQIITAVCLIKNSETIQFQDCADLLMREDLSDEEIERYIAYDQPLDCAGSYKIESLGPSLFQAIQCNDQATITGLPLIQLAKYLRSWGIPCP